MVGSYNACFKRLRNSCSVRRTTVMMKIRTLIYFNSEITNCLPCVHFNQRSFVDNSLHKSEIVWFNFFSSIAFSSNSIRFPITILVSIKMFNNEKKWDDLLRNGTIKNMCCMFTVD